MDVFETACRHAAAYRASVAKRPVRPARSYSEILAAGHAALPDHGIKDDQVIDELVALADPGLTQVVHPRFFGWVMGGSSPVSVAADWLVSAWGQNAGIHVSSPAAAAIEEISARWLLEILDLPRTASVGFATGGTMGSFIALAAARGKVLRDHGWNCETDGLFGAPPVHVFVGADVHASVLSTLRYLGFGTRGLVRVDTDDQGRMKSTDLSRQVTARQGAMIVVGQAGQINTGAFDPFPDLADIAGNSGAWLHIDGAFGLWARAHPELKKRTTGIELADSWVVDGHKWLQVPFDAGYAIIKNREEHERAMATKASYLQPAKQNERVPSHFVPELSRRARGIPTWAALKSLGRRGIAELVGRHCTVASHIAENLAAISGITVLNDVVLNQVIVRFGYDHDTPETREMRTNMVIDLLVKEGLVFVAGADWRGERVMRISVTSGETTLKDAEIAVRSIKSAWCDISSSQFTG